MPNTAKFADLEGDARFALHTATIDPKVTEGDAKIWGCVEHIDDEALHQRFATHLFELIGLDLRGQRFDRFLRANLQGAAAAEINEGHLDITAWKLGHNETETRKH